LFLSCQGLNVGPMCCVRVRFVDRLLYLHVTLVSQM